MEYKSIIDLFYKFQNQNRLFGAQIAVTYRCNLDCIHCFENKDTSGELALADIKNLLLELKEIGCLTVCFTGGEMFLRDDILEIFAFARKKKFGIKILTNGTLLTEKLVKQIKKFNPLLVQVSLYGASSKVHDAITRIKGSYERALESVRLLKKYNLKFRIATSVMRHNAHEIKKIREMAKEKGWPFAIDYGLTARFDGSKLPLKYRINQKQLNQTVRELCLENEFLPKPPQINKDKFFYFLPLGRNRCYISAQGDVYPLCTLRIKLGSLREDSFKDIWNNSEVVQELRKLKQNDFACFNCRLVNYCCWDLGMAWLECGDCRVPPKEICRIMNARLRRDGKVFK